MSEFKPALLHKDLFKACMWVKRMTEEDGVSPGLACYKAGQYYGYSASDVGWARNQLKQSQDKPGLFYSRGGPVSRKRPTKREKKIPLSERSGTVENRFNIDALGLSTRSSNCLKRADIRTVEKLQNTSFGDLIQIRNLGNRSVDEINEKLSQRGLKGITRRIRR